MPVGMYDDATWIELMPAILVYPRASQEEDRSTRDLELFREHLSSGPPGPHAYIVLLGLRTFDLARVLKTVEQGITFSALERLHRNVGLSLEELGELVQISRRTMARRKQEGRFLPEESDRLLRAARLFAKALELFDGNSEESLAWLTASQPALGGAVPLTVARTEVGAREVLALIDRLQQGVYS